MFLANWQPGVPKYNWVNWQWAGFTNHNKHRHSGRNAHFQRRITECSIVFQINKYVTLTCFLNVCKHIMVFLCFSRVKILHTAHLNVISQYFFQPCSTQDTIAVRTFNLYLVSGPASLFISVILLYQTYSDSSLMISSVFCLRALNLGRIMVFGMHWNTLCTCLAVDA